MSLLGDCTEAKPNRETHTADSHLLPFAQHQLCAHSNIQMPEPFCAEQHEGEWWTGLRAAAACLDHVRLPCGV